MFVGVESERYLKTLAQLGEGGPRQWWVREFCEWKSEEIGKMKLAPHPAYWPPSPRRRRQRTNWLLLTKKIKLINKIND